MHRPCQLVRKDSVRVDSAVTSSSGSMNVADFDFFLPDELVAQEAAPRGRSRLMVLDRVNGSVTHESVDTLPSLLRAGDVIVVNNTRVLPARLIGKRVPSGGSVECMLLNRVESHPAGAETWMALVHPGQKLHPGARMRFTGSGDRDHVLAGEIREQKFHGRRIVRLWPEGPGTVEEIVDAIGHIPLPPYIKRDDTSEDRERYQTVYARERGSVAAPTAGLHFSEELLGRVKARGVEVVEVTLHVGYGTFKPIRTNVVEEHVVDPEPYAISDAAADAIARAKRDRRRVIAAGTTTTRALEQAAIAGAGHVPPGRGEASVFIYPGFPFQVIDALLTNFHLPKSSLLMLVAAFAGRERVLAAYEQAVRQRYRFYSYGDAMLIQ
jgi:S-adenosylmethionine:tRNA ribosyltransferase-isomerase